MTWNWSSWYILLDMSYFNIQGGIRDFIGGRQIRPNSPFSSKICEKKSVFYFKKSTILVGSGRAQPSKMIVMTPSPPFQHVQKTISHFQKLSLLKTKPCMCREKTCFNNFNYGQNWDPMRRPSYIPTSFKMLFYNLHAFSYCWVIIFEFSLFVNAAYRSADFSSCRRVFNRQRRH